VQRAAAVAISGPVLGCIERKKCNLRFRALLPIDPMAGHSMFTKGTGIALALLSFLILGAAFPQNIAAGVVVFITGMIMPRRLSQAYWCASQSGGHRTLARRGA
jgi:hypothetical protein